jgi:hypothetical protein
VAKCIETLKVCQGAEERQDYAFNVTDEFALRWQPNRAYQTGQAVRPNALPGTGFEYVATAADSSGGMSADQEPNWTKTVGATVVDGSITWTCQLPTYDSLRERIDSVDWDSDSDPSDLVLADQVEQDIPGLQEARIWVSGGVVGQVYNCRALITTEAGARYECRLEVTII